GNVYSYGTTTDSRVLAVAAYGSTINSASVRVWALANVTDSHGNSFSVSYTNNASTGDFYPYTIKYTLGNGRTSSNFNIIQFGYASRTDHQDMFGQTARVNLQSLLNKVWVCTKATSASATCNDSPSGSTLVRKYVLSYLTAPATGHSRLVSVQEYGS